MGQRIDVMISSTARDLPEHRKQAMEAILRMSMHPIGMEHLPAKSEDAIDASLKMVDEAEIYLGIFAHRYGYIPESPKNPDKVSITELEYRRAVERDIPRLIFIMGDEHPLSAKDLETDPEGSAKLLRFKNELKTNYVVSFFNSPEQLREQVITALAQYRQSDVAQLHYISDIPKLPEPYIAHPYTLLQTSQLFGRQTELNLLTDWVAKPDAEVYQARILNIVAIGGMGKSALTWKWFNDIAPQEMKPLAGRMWWSFYESDASFENFVIRALAYVTETPRDAVEKMNPIERENALLKALNEKPFLLVLDGLERILVAYARMDAAYLKDDDLDEQTANRVAGALYTLTPNPSAFASGRGESENPSVPREAFYTQHLLRKTADPRAGNFLRKLANEKLSRILVSTRLYPADLQTVTGGCVPGSFASFLMGLGDDDALDLWRAMGVSGSRDALLPMFKTFDNYPLLIRALAGEVARFRKAPGDFDAWRKRYPDFNPMSLPLVQVKSHVLAYALQGLEENERKVLHTVAAFRMPATYDTLMALLVGNDKLYQAEQELDGVLADLEDRGLLGWDKRANRYDLHPIVRGVVWDTLEEINKHGIYAILHDHFRAIPFPDNFSVKKLDDLSPAIELYNSLIGLKLFDYASELVRNLLNNLMLNRLNATQYNVYLLKSLFPDGLDSVFHIKQIDTLLYIMIALGQSYQFSGQPQKAVETFLAATKIKRNGETRYRITAFSHLAGVLRHIGSLYQSEISAIKAINYAKQIGDDFRESEALYWIGLTYAYSGNLELSDAVHKKAYILFTKMRKIRSQAAIRCHVPQKLYWCQQFEQALMAAKKAKMFSEKDYFGRMVNQAERMVGLAALGAGNWELADKELGQALNRARTISHTQEELASAIALAELARLRGDQDTSREYLADLWSIAESGPYPLFHADALNVLAQIERDAGNTDKAVEAATKAYELAWCDGISEDGKQCYAYWWGLQKAKKHLEELGAPIPQLPYFDESKHEPLPEIDWDALLKGEDQDEMD